MADLAGGDAYFADTLRNGAWHSFGADQKAAAIREAGRMIDRLPFPRRPPLVNVDNAAYEQAYCLLAQNRCGGEDEAAKAIAKGVKSRSVADASESYTSAAEREKDPGWIGGVYYCPQALSWLNGYIGSQRVRTGRYVMRDER